MIKKIYLFIFLIILYLIYLYRIKEFFRYFYTRRIKKKIIGFQVCGIGNGHLSQAKVIYDIMIKKYHIPVVIIYGQDKGYDNRFKFSKVIYVKTFTDTASINSMDYSKIVADICTLKNTKTYEDEYNVNIWFNFWINDWFNYRTKQYMIGNQLSISHFGLSTIFLINKLLSVTVPVSILMKNKYGKLTIPSLIDSSTLCRKNINRKIILAYSSIGEDFIKRLKLIALSNKNYTFHLFKNYNTQIKLPKNVIIHMTNKEEFKKYMKICGAVFATAGLELTQECVYNKIPVAIMPCSKVHFEQMFNYNTYIYKYNWAVSMDKNLNLDKLTKRNMTIVSNKFRNAIKKRNSIIMNLTKS